MEKYITQTMEELQVLASDKMELYLAQDHITCPESNRMMTYENKLASEHELFLCMRRINYLLDMVIGE